MRFHSSPLKASCDQSCSAPEGSWWYRLRRGEREVGSWVCGDRDTRGERYGGLCRCRRTKRGMAVFLSAKAPHSPPCCVSAWLLRLVHARYCRTHVMLSRGLLPVAVDTTPTLQVMLVVLLVAAAYWGIGGAREDVSELR